MSEHVCPTGDHDDCTEMIIMPAAPTDPYTKLDELVKQWRGNAVFPSGEQEYLALTQCADELEKAIAELRAGGGK